MEQAQPVQRSNPLRSLVKGILFIIVKVLMVVMGFWRRYPLPALILLVMVIGSLFALSSGVVAMPWTPAAAPVPEARVAIEAYLAGQKDYNADLMWQAMDDDLKQAWQQNGRSLQELRQQQQQYKQAGIKFGPSQHVFSTDLDDGRKVFLYIVKTSVTTPQGAVDRQVPYTFTVNKAGKIVGVD
jgi:hypothetical protein